jgi:hypothetical protein
MLGNRRCLLLFTLVGVSASACSDSDPLYRVCTEIGCSNGLHVTFGATPVAGTVVQAEIPGGAPWRVECGVDQQCEHRVFFPDLRPDWVMIRITSPAGELLHEVRPQYVESRPNGPGCEPTCFNATVELSLP